MQIGGTVLTTGCESATDITMTSSVTNRQSLLDLAKATLEALHDEPGGLEAGGDVHPDAVKN